jgi:chromosome segregation ATPase
MSDYEHILLFQEKINKLEKEIEERDRAILRLNQDFNESTDQYQREIEERDRTIAQLTAKQEDHLNHIEILKSQIHNYPRMDYGTKEKLKEIQKHLISLEVDLELLGSWTKDWMKADYSEVLTHAQKCYLSKQKISQVNYLKSIIEKLLESCVVSNEF